MNNFVIAFFRLYDRKISSGEIRFSELGLSRDDFTRLCTGAELVMDKEKVKELCIRMKLTKEESEELISAYLA